LIRRLLFPIAILYGLILSIRNGLFNIKIFKSQHTTIPSIGIGNLSIGGTGKSIVVDYLITKLQMNYIISVISRGYGRKSSGFIMANSSSTALEIGDEPYQFLKKYPKIRVAVGEDRVITANKVLKIDSKVNLLILDDVMQHRWIITDHLLLTTTYADPFFNDFLFPSGNLREFSRGKKRSESILVTKCPSNISRKDRLYFEKKCKLSSNQKIFFTKITYSKTIINNQNKLSVDHLKEKKIILVTGIANPLPLLDFLNSKNIFFKHLNYRDHYNFNKASIDKIKNEAGSSLILSTEKDYGRLYPLMKSDKLFYLPISLSFFSNNEEIEFNDRVKSFIDTKYISSHLGPMD